MKNAIKKLVDFAIITAKPEKIILFGSYRYGTNNIHSDIDLLIIVNDKHMKKELALRILNFVKECSTKADILVYTPNDIQKEASNPFSFINLIMKEGQTLYDNTLSLT